MDGARDAAVGDDPVATARVSRRAQLDAEMHRSAGSESVLTEEQKFLFDLRGFLVLPGVLSRDDCERLIRFADHVWPRQPEDGPYRRTGEVSQWGKPFLDLIDHPKVLPYLAELIGSKLRLDHDYCIFMREAASRNQLHGGPFRYETDHWYRYHDGVMRNGLTVATWNLTDAPAGAGGFTCVPGSHKSNFLKHMPADVARFERDADWVVQPPMQAGDVLIFTEALIHGTAEWKAKHERRTLLYKYSPPHSTWAKRFYNLDDYPDATDRQRRLLAGPSVEAHERVWDG